jgi:hypothetical protein
MLDLFLGSFSKHIETNSTKFSDQRLSSFLNRGGLRNGICMSARNGFIYHNQPAP